MVIKFDDSVLEDIDAIANRAMREVNLGLLSKVEYRMKVFAETEEIATQKIKKINEENPSIDDLLGTRNETPQE